MKKNVIERPVDPLEGLVWDRLRAWCKTQDHDVGYEFYGLQETAMSASFLSLVKEVVALLKERAK